MKDEYKSKEESNSRLVTSFRSFSQFSGIFVALVGGAVTIGWMFDVSILKSIHPHLVAMKANTALAFVLIGVSLYLLQTETPRSTMQKRKRNIAQVCALLVSFIGLLSLSEYLFGVNLGIDQLLFKEPIGAVGTSHPGRMAPNTALNFLLIGMALFFFDLETKRRLRPAQLLILPEGIVSLIALIGYIYSVPIFYGLLHAFTWMALNTAVLFNLIFFSFLFARPDRGLIMIVTSNTTGGILLRRLFPAITFTLVGLGWLRLLGEQKGFYGNEFGIALFVTLNIVIFAILIFATSKSLHRIDIERNRAEEELKKHREHLEELVKERTEKLELEITERKRADEAIRQASNYNRSLIEASLDPLVTISPEGEVTDVNKATELVTGVQREQLIGTDFSNYFTEPEKARNGYQQVLKEGMVRDYPLAIRHTSGRVTEVLYNASIYKDQDGKLLGVFAAARDITELKKTEQIKRQRSILERINKGLREAIMSETVEEVASKCLGLGEELTGSKFGFIGEVNQVGRFDCIALSNPGWDACRISHSDAVKLLKNMEIRGLWSKVLKDEHSQIVNDPSSHPDRAGIPEGHPALTSFLGVPLKHAGKTIGMIALANKESGYDVDDQEIIETLSRAFGEVLMRKRSEEMVRRLNEDLKRRNLELEAINKELEAFSYSVSHDLRAPLRGIDGFSRALLEDYGDKLDQQGKDHLQRVRSASQRMGEIIEGMLNLARVTRTPLHQQVIDLSVRARSIVAQLQEKQPERQVEFVIAEGVMGNGDRWLLEIVLENLLSNAWKFTEKHPRARIEFGVMQKEGESVYFVRDDGTGFDMAYVDKLFGAFQRLHTKDEFEGTGIGLATVQRIIHRHGGRIWAEGGVEKGATFYFTLPVVNEPITTETINQEGIYEQQVCLVSGRQ